MEYPTSPLGKCVCKENTGDEWNILWHTTEKAIDAVHDGKVGSELH